MQENDYRWFLDHYKELYQKYGHKFLAIKDEKVIGTYDSYAEGVRETLKTEPIGSFIVQECNGDKSAYTGYISSIRMCAF